MQTNIEIAKSVIENEIETLHVMSGNIGSKFDRILQLVVECEGKVVLCGMGKSGHIAKKISATLASLGTQSFFLHPAEAMHGDLGMVSKKDVVIMLSNSGETSELISIIPSLKVIGAKIVLITGKHESTLAKNVDVVQEIYIEREACNLNLAPTSSTTAMLVYGDALAVAASYVNGFNKSEFGLLHPAGMLGKKVLLKVDDIMVKDEMIPVVESGTCITDAILEMSRKGLGVIGIISNNGILVGLLTDGDLRRAIEKHANLYTENVDTIMTLNPKTVNKDVLLVDVLVMLRESHLNNYPVVDETGRLIGMLTWQMINNQGIII